MSVGERRLLLMGGRIRLMTDECVEDAGFDWSLFS